MSTNTENKSVQILPALAIRGMVAFPKLIMHFDVARDISVAAINTAMSNNRKIFLVAQKDLMVEEPGVADLYKTGVVCEIRQVLKTGDSFTRVLVEGLYRAKLNKLFSDLEYLEAEIKPLPDYSKSKINETEITALIRSLKAAFESYSNFLPQMPKELVQSVVCQDDPYLVFENITFNISLDFHDKQQLLEASDITSKLNLLLNILTKEIQVLDVERKISEQVKENIDKSQHDYYLREQMKVISSQLGEDDSLQDEAYEYFEKIFALNLSEEITVKLTKEAERLTKMPPSAQEAFVIRNYLDTCLELPWNKTTKSKIDIEKAQSILDKDHYGLKKVKERILETIAVHALLPEVTGQIICLVGPPGVGKTSIGKSVAKALGRKYARVSLGGVKDESDIRGHRKTYIGSMPGRIINAVKLAGSNNPLILLDEIDKMSNDFRGDPASAMLEVLDSEQNKEFRDHYIELPFDLSRVLFITTANSTDTIPAPLLDRMEVIEIPSYTREEKFQIASRHLISKQLKKNGLKASQMKVDDSGIYFLIDYYTREAGVRTLERLIASLCRKAAKEIVSGNAKKIVFSSKNIENYLGIKKYHPDEKSETNEIGVVNGLAWTSAGGVLMPLEALVLDGKGNIELTGSLGDVMKESAKIAVSYCRSVAKRYNIDEKFYRQKDMHIHAPEGAVPKDGPSAGVTMVTAMISALSGIPVKRNVAMTGEITLHGKVLAIGGLREKTMAAYRNGIDTVIVPIDNKPDLEEIDEVVRTSLNFIFASRIEEVLDVALVTVPKTDENLLIVPQEYAGSTAVRL